MKDLNKPKPIETLPGHLQGIDEEYSSLHKSKETIQSDTQKELKELSNNVKFNVWYKLLETNREEFFKKFISQEVHKQSWALTLIKIAAERYPEATLLNYPNYKLTKGSEEILVQLCSLKPGTALENITAILWQVFSEEILKKIFVDISNKKPYELFNAMITLDDHLDIYKTYRKIKNEILSLALSKIKFDLPANINKEHLKKGETDLFHFLKYKNLKGAGNAIREAAAFVPKEAFLKFKEYQNEVYADEVIKTAYQNLRLADLMNEELIETIKSNAKINNYQKGILEDIEKKARFCGEVGMSFINNTIYYSTLMKLGEKGADYMFDTGSLNYVLQNLLKINREWIKSTLSKEKTDFYIFMIARNLYFADKEISEHTVLEEFKSIKKFYDKEGKYPLPTIKDKANKNHEREFKIFALFLDPIEKKKYFEKLFKDESEEIFDWIKEIANENWYLPLMQKFVAARPDFAFQNYMKYRKLDHGMELFNMVAKTDPEKTFKFFFDMGKAEKNFKNYRLNKDLKDYFKSIQADMKIILPELAKIAPKEAFRFIFMFNNRANEEDELDEDLKIAIFQNAGPNIKVDEVPYYIDSEKKDWAIAVFYYSSDLSRESWGRDLMLAAAVYAPAEAFKNYEKYSSAAYADEIIETAYKNLKFNDFQKSLIEYIENLKNISLKTEILDYVTNKIEENEEITNSILAQEKKTIQNMNQDKPFSLEYAYGKLSYTAFLGDPAIQNLHLIEQKWLYEKNIPAEKIPQYMALIARYLYFQNKTIDKETVLEAYDNIIEYQNQNAKKPIFKGRNVVFIANSEKLRGEIKETEKTRYEFPKDGINRFGKDATLEEIKNQGGNLSLYRFSEKETKEGKKKIKNEIINKISSTVSPLTLFFDAHGGPEVIGLEDDPMQMIGDASGIITYQELAEALIKRNEYFPDEEPPMLIFHSCYSHSYLRNLYKELQNKARLPITFGISEYNQIGVSNFASPYGSTFMEKILKMGEKGHISTIGDVIENEEKGETNPSLYIPSEPLNPSEPQIPVQIVEKGEKEPKSARA